MLLAFRTANFRSLRDEMELSLMVPARVSLEDRVERRVSTASADRVGTVAGIYGANASGKSNVLGAIRAMCEAVRESHQRWTPADGAPHDPFRLDAEHGGLPTLFEAELLLDGRRWQYGFRLDREGVAAEWLYAFPRGRRRVWFERERGRDLYAGKSLSGPIGTLRELTRPNSLFLSVGAANNHPELSRVANWLSVAWFSAPNRDRGDYSVTHGLLTDPRFAPRVQQQLAFADLGITHVEVRDLHDIAADVLFHHRTGGGSVALPRWEESLGTQAWYRLLGPLVLALDRGSLLVVDELESSVHPQLLARLVRMFHDRGVNPEAAQLVFTSHDTSLLGNLSGDQPLHRDELWLTEKDAEGVTRLYPATDFHPRKHENLERGYLQGRYGGVPVLRYPPAAAPGPA